MSWPTPQAWLYSWVDTGSPGYKKVNIAGSAITISDGHRRWPDYISQIHSTVAGVNAAYYCVANATGGVRLGGAPTITWTDRLGWLLGMGSEPGDTAGSATYSDSVEVAPGAVPLLSASWSAINRKSEEKLLVDRHLRGHGYVYGAADLWKWRILVHVSAVPSFKAGFCLSGKVTISSYAPSDFGSDSAFSKANADGYVDGHVIGVSGGKWLDDTRTIWSTDLIMAREVTT
tara:strand:- start:6544 stop:7236 length:693 start_codon:yes stop_codon:yes gene_type:complete